MSLSTASSLGEFLRHEREQRGLTAEQVASATKISLRIIHSLESDLYEELPAKPFVRGFVIAYCRFLGINSHEVLTRFSRFLDEKSEERPRKDGGHSGYAFDRKEGDQARTGLWIVMGVMVVLGALVVVIARPSLKRHHRVPVDKLRASHGETPKVEASPSPSVTPTPSPTPSSAASVSPSPKPSPSPSSSPSASPSPGPSPSPSPSPKPEPSRRPDPLLSGKDLFKDEIRVKVVIEAKKDMWVKFKVDDKERNKIVLRPGIILVLLGKDAVLFQTSNPADAVVTRAAGLPNALKAIGTPQPLDQILASKQGVLEGGLTLGVAAQGVEIKANPFKGEAPMVPPPAKTPAPSAPPAAGEAAPPQ